MHDGHQGAGDPRRVGVLDDVPAVHDAAGALTRDVEQLVLVLRSRQHHDGRGFPFRGSYDLEALNRMNAGPLTLKERVAELGGEMIVVSSETGAEILMTLPLARVPI